MSQVSGFGVVLKREEGERTSKLCHQSSTALSETDAGVDMNAALSTSTSQVPTAAATFFNPSSSVTLTAWTEQSTLFGGRRSFVSARVPSLRPRRMSCFAPALAKAMAVSRPIPLPLGDITVSNLKTEIHAGSPRGKGDRLTAPVMMTALPATLSSGREGEIAG